MGVFVVRTGPQSDLARYVRARLKEEAGGRDRAGYQAEVVRRTGLKSSTVANIFNAKQGVGMDSGAKIAKAWGLSYAQLVEAAEEWANSAPPASGPPRVRRPNLEKAIESVGALPDEVLEEAWALAAHTRRDYSKVAWMVLLEEIARANAETQRSTAQLPARPRRAAS